MKSTARIAIEVSEDFDLKPPLTPTDIRHWETWDHRGRFDVNPLSKWPGFEESLESRIMQEMDL